MTESEESASKRNWLLFSCHLRWKILFERRCRMTEMDISMQLSKISQQRNPFRREREENETKTRLFNIQNGDRVCSDVHCVCQLAPSGRAHTHTPTQTNIEHDERTRVYRYAKIHFRETQTEFINVRLKMISGRKKNGSGVQKDSLSRYHDATFPCGSWNAACVRHTLFDFHKLLLLSNATFADPENVERILHIRWKIRNIWSSSILRELRVAVTRIENFMEFVFVEIQHNLYRKLPIRSPFICHWKRAGSTAEEWILNSKVAITLNHESKKSFSNIVSCFCAKSAIQIVRKIHHRCRKNTSEVRQTDDFRLALPKIDTILRRRLNNLSRVHTAWAYLPSPACVESFVENGHNV